MAHNTKTVDQWLLFDTHIKLSSLNEANSPDNYILLFKKKVTESRNENENFCQVNESSVNIQDEVVETSSVLGQHKSKPDDMEISTALCLNNRKDHK